MKRVAIVQSNYVPWKGYFDLIRFTDEFIIYDDVQYTRRDWRNRNLIKTATGLSWLTIPVEAKGNYHQQIRDVQISDPKWGSKHWSALMHNYARAPFFKTYRPLFEPLYLSDSETYLSEINRKFIEVILPLIGIDTPIRSSSEFDLVAGRSERLVQLCVSTGATIYLSGPAARDYLDEQMFSAEGISVQWMDYSGYPIYPQLFGTFEHGVSILDLLFNTGAAASTFMKSRG